jgi:signal transduction histidine kinase
MQEHYPPQNAVDALQRELLVEALEQAQSAECARTDFLSNMSHDLRTPMNAIIGYTSLALAHLDDRERLEDYLDKIEQSSYALLSFFNTVLDMNRIGSGRIYLDETPENLRSLVLRLGSSVLDDASAKQLDFRIDTTGITDEEIYCDKLRLSQVLSSLLSNAVKYTPPGGEISLSVRQFPSAVNGCAICEFRVRDNGIGMSEEFAAQIFEPFTREHTSTISGIRGAGLGLSIAKSLVELMGGTLTLSSRAGEGSEFVVTVDVRLQNKFHARTNNFLTEAG